MPWRLSDNLSLSGERGLYPLCARYQGNLDIGFFIAQFSTPFTSNHHPRGPPIHPIGATQNRHSNAFYTSTSYL